MARAKNYEVQLETLDEQIQRTQERLNKLCEQRDDLISKKQAEELSELYNTIQSNNITVEEVIQLITQNESVKQSA